MSRDYIDNQKKLDEIDKHTTKLPKLELKWEYVKI